ncbi:Clp protease N-terminal domain-containing protein [Actinomycetes bacterium KLBMP 9797]
MSIHEQSPFVHFDDRAKRVVDLARQRASVLRSDVIGPEHVLLALLAVPNGRAARAIATLVGSRARAEGAITEALTPGDKPSPTHMRFTATVEEAMTQAARQAQQLANDRIGTEHLLLGLLMLSDSPAVRRLTALGMDYTSARAEIARFRTDDTGEV